MTSSHKRMGFYLDLSACTGCKACQVACKNKNGQDADFLWRRVVEVTGGGWLKRGEAWIHRTLTYNISLSCMHCQKPICVEVCPSKAASVRADGVVYIDPERCIGCSYCEMACPYGAPVLDFSEGVMTKCDFCKDQLDEGKPPECVMACQMRVIEYGPIDELRAKRGDRDELFPLPSGSITEPSVVFKPHKDSVNSPTVLVVANREELK